MPLVARWLAMLPADVPLIQSRDRRLIASHGPRGLVIAPSRDGTEHCWAGQACRSCSARAAARHLDAAACGLTARVFEALEIDVDRPDDLLLLAESDGETETQRLARELCVAERVMCV
jgi:2-phospho-L-lactate guanylyltransferase (CobY/MobA/RfbA family)